MYPNLQNIFSIPEDQRKAHVAKIQYENLIYRAELLDKAERDPDLRRALFAACSHDAPFFFNNFLYTYDPRLRTAHLPFVTYPFQDNFLHILTESVGQSSTDNSIDVRVEKSRDMGFSWNVLGFLARDYLFNGNSALIGSYKEDYVHDKGNMDSAFERLFYMIDRLPRWLKYEDLEKKYMNLSSKSRNISIDGDAGENFGTGGRRKTVFLDEFQARAADEKAFRKTKDISSCRIFGGTPEGTYNVYGKVMTNHRDYAHLQKTKITLHWPLHPLKTKKRYEEEKKKRTDLDVAKELDISYQNSVTGAVYPHFNRMIKTGHFPYDPNLKLYGSRDFGLDMNAFIFWQKDFRTNRLYIIKSIQRHLWELKKFAGLVIGKQTQGYVYTQDENNFIQQTALFRPFSGHMGDPYNSDNRSTINISDTIRTTLWDFGVYLETNRLSTVEDRIKKASLALERICIDESNVDLIESLVQSHYPQIPENSQRTSEAKKPVHDESSHYRTAFEYFLDLEPQHFAGSEVGEVDYSDYI